MKRLFAMIAIGMALLTLLSACGSSSPEGETSNKETPSATAESKFDIGKLMNSLIDQGVTYGIGDDITQPFFSVAGQTIIVHQEPVQVFNYASSDAAQADADLVSPSGSPVGTTMVSWVAPPHFYLKDSLLVLYVGGNGPVIDLLDTIMGPQFAGADSTTVEPNSYADAAVRSYLSLMLNLTSYLNSFTSGRAPAEFAIESITTVASQLEGYTLFFSDLEGDQANYVFETYGEEFRRSAESVTNAALTIQEDGVNEIIATALARIPAFAIATMTTSTTYEPATAPASYIATLLLPREVAALANGVELTTQYRDGKSMAAAVDPAQVERMDSFDSLSFDTADSSQGLTMTTIKFDSEEAATDHWGVVASELTGMEDLPDGIGDSSVYIEANEAGIGSMLVFKKGLWVVSLHTTQVDGVTPLVDLAGVEALARTVADRL